MIQKDELITHKEGATYEIPYFVVSKNGLEVSGGKLIQFVKGAKDNEEIFRQAGFITEDVLKVCKKYLEDVNEGDLKDEDTSMAIVGIERALHHLSERAEKRKARGVQGTYKK